MPREIGAGLPEISKFFFLTGCFTPFNSEPTKKLSSQRDESFAHMVPPKLQHGQFYSDRVVTLMMITESPFAPTVRSGDCSEVVFGFPYLAALSSGDAASL